MKRADPTLNDTAGIPVPPPLVLLIALGFGLTLDTVAPLGLPWLARWPARAAAIVIAGVAVAIGRWQVATFRQLRTPIPTWLPTKALATTGPYRFSRNPDYVAQALLYLALSLAFGGWWSLFAFVPTIVAIRYGVISQEERYLEERFGEEYRAYKRRVRRWV